MAKEISISHFKTHCLEIIKELQIGHEPIVITKRHKPVAKIHPINELEKTSIFGLFKDKAKIKNNIVNSVNEDWEAE